MCEFLTPYDLARFLCVAKTEVPLAGTGVDWSEQDFSDNAPERAESLAFQSGATLLGLYLGNTDFLSKPDKQVDVSRLRTLTLVGVPMHGAVDLSPLIECPQLRTLEITNFDGISNAHTLAELKHLRHLKIFLMTGIKDLAMLRYCQDLESLQLEGLTGITDLISVGALSHIKEISLDRCPSIKDLWPLARCQEIEYVSITKCDKLAGDAVAALAACAKLEKLDICDQRRAKGLDQLHALKNFEVFRSQDVQVSDDMQGLSQCSNMRHLYINDCQKQLPNLKQLGVHNMKKLEILDLSGNRVTSLQPLAEAENLQELWIQNVKGLKNLQGLENCEELTEVHANLAVSLTNIKALEGLENLTIVDISECSKITNIAALGSCTSLEILNISETDVKDLKPLAGCSELFKFLCNRCERIETLAPLTPEALPKLAHIEAACPDLVDIGDLGRPTLRIVDLTGCADLKNISGLEGSTDLHFLNLRDCANVRDLSVLYDLPSLRTLNIVDCSKIRRVPKELADKADKKKLKILGDPMKEPIQEGLASGYTAYRDLQRALPNSAPQLLGLCDMSELY